MLFSGLCARDPECCWHAQASWNAHMHTCKDEAVVSGPVLDLWSNRWVKSMDHESLIWKKELKNDGLSSRKKQTSRGVRSLSHGGKRHSGLGQGGWA